MSDEAPLFPADCEHCGAPLRDEVRYPTITVDGDDGTVDILTFCREQCKVAWHSDDADESDGEQSRSSVGSNALR